MAVPTWALACAALAAVFAVWIAFRIGRWRGRRLATSNADEGARRQIAGRVAELWAPYESGFPGEIEDAWFLGSPIDFVVFDGLSDGALDEVVFVEVKSGSGKLTKRERMIRDAVTDGRVRWLEFRIED